MKLNRRTTWIIIFFLCTLLWGLFFGALVYGSEFDKTKPVSTSDKISEDVKRKINSLNLNDKQKKFLESLIEDSKKK